MVYVATSAYQLHPRQIFGAMVVIKDANLCIRFLSTIFSQKIWQRLAYSGHVGASSLYRRLALNV